MPFQIGLDDQNLEFNRQKTNENKKKKQFHHKIYFYEGPEVFENHPHWKYDVNISLTIKKIPYPIRETKGFDKNP
jgi:hypothetical protein